MNDSSKRAARAALQGGSSVSSCPVRRVAICPGATAFTRIPVETELERHHLGEAAEPVLGRGV